MYGKISNKKIVYLQGTEKRLIDEANGLVVVNPTEEEFARAGYTKLAETGKPTDGKDYASSWKISRNKIVCEWVEQKASEV